MPIAAEEQDMSVAEQIKNKFPLNEEIESIVGPQKLSGTYFPYRPFKITKLVF